MNSQDILTVLRPTAVYDSYWKFAAERQEIFFRRYDSEPLDCWTQDPILINYKFTNAYRASDRVSQFLIDSVIYSGDQAPEEIFFRVILFKLFNKIETWKNLREKLGGNPAYASFDMSLYGSILTSARQAGERIYSGAYISPSGVSSFGFREKHMNHLSLLARMMEDDLACGVANAESLESVYQLFTSYPMIGPFIGYQLTIDVNYSELVDFSEMDFVVAGPGARDGISKCFENFEAFPSADIIQFVTENQQAEFAERGISFRNLFGRDLQLIDCQNLFCEIGKYARVKHPDVLGVSGRTRIKQKFRANHTPISYTYPPKWGISADKNET